MTAVLSYLQATRSVARSASEVHATLQTDGAVLAEAATAQAVTAVAPLLEAAGLRRPPAPLVATRVPDRGPAALRVTWDHDRPDRWPPATPFATRPTSRWWRTGEEETGWPVATLDVVVEPRAGGTQVTVVSDRTPGVDLSTNRVDKRARDQAARAAIERFLDALVTLLGAGVDAPALEV
jgi:hypothetical protein